MMEQLHQQEPTQADAAEQLAKQEKYRRLFRNGTRWLGAGILLMGISFGINYFMFQSGGSFEWIMYILTSVGGLAIMKGLADMLGF